MPTYYLYELFTNYWLQVVFKGSLSGYGGGIALDDIRMSPISCQVLADCDFEQGGICTWTQSHNDDFDWLVNSGETASLDTGPPSDHTTGTESGEREYYFPMTWPTIIF